MPRLKPLLLAGGQSSRMGERKALFILPDHEDPIYVRLLALLYEACSEPSDNGREGKLEEEDKERKDAYLSVGDDARAINALLAQDQIVGRWKTFDGKDFPTPPVDGRKLYMNKPGDMDDALCAWIIFDSDHLGEDDRHDSSADGDIGPAAGLLAAHRHDPTATWMVVACDYPLLTLAALRQLRDAFSSDDNESPPCMACFRNKDGFNEPLLGIWTPTALRGLEANVRQGILGPSAVVRNLEGCKTIRPEDEQWLLNMNTPEDWQRAMEIKSGEARAKGIFC